MSMNDYSALSDERLLELFIDGARQLGFVTNRNERLRWLKGARETKPEVDDEARMPIIERTREIRRGAARAEINRGGQASAGG